MSTDNTCPIPQKSIGEIAEFLKNLIPANIPEGHALHSRFKNVATGEEIHRGIVAYRDFLGVMCDRLICDGASFFSLPKKPTSPTDYPFVIQITDLLADIGYYGWWADDGDAWVVAHLPSFFVVSDETGNRRKPRNSVSKLCTCLRFVSLCGLVFPHVDVNAKIRHGSEIIPLIVRYPANPRVLTGLKVMAITDMELRAKRYKNDNNHDNLLRCDYTLTRAEAPDVDELVRTFLQAVPGDVQRFALALHRRHLDMGMTCAPIISTFETHFAYSYVGNSRRAVSTRDAYQKRIWEFSLSIRHGYCLVVRAKKTDAYADVVAGCPPPLREKIAHGYGCDRKLRNEPCQVGCQGVRFPLDDSILPIGPGIETWLDKEVFFRLPTSARPRESSSIQRNCCTTIRE